MFNKLRIKNLIVYSKKCSIIHLASIFCLPMPWLSREKIGDVPILEYHLSNYIYYKKNKWIFFFCIYLYLLYKLFLPFSMWKSYFFVMVNVKYVYCQHFRIQVTNFFFMQMVLWLSRSNEYHIFH